MSSKKSVKGASYFTLMVGDEGAVLIQMQRKRVIKRMFASSPEPENVRVIEEILSASPNAPITMLVDMMDQSYVRQTLPPVSSFSVGKIVKRRLDKDFSPDDIKGYLMLGREKTGRKDWNYLMASLANPPILQKWINFAVERSNPFKGIGLIPLESQDFIIAANKASLQKGDDAKSFEWQILISHHKVGGFRQIVLRNGKLVFTRMAQPIGESSPGVIAGNIEQEMINTLEYLKRMGLQDATSLSVIIVASEDIKTALEPKNIKAGEYHFFTPYEVASLLNLTDAAQPEDHFGDIVISAFIAKRRKLILLLQTPYIQKIRNLSIYIKSAWAIGALCVVGLLTWAGMSEYDILDAKHGIDVLETEHVSSKQKLESVKVKAQVLPKKITMLADIVMMVKTLEKRRYDPLVFINNLAGSLHDAALVKAYHWAISDVLAVTPAVDKRQVSADIDLRLTIPSEPHNQFVAASQALMDRIKESFSGFDVTHSELPGLLSDTKELKTVIGDTGAASAPDQVSQTENNVKVTIKGPIEEPAVRK